MKRYKVLTKDLKSPFRDFQYELNKWYTCNNFDTDKSEDCSSGFYATHFEGVLYSNLSKDKRVYECKVGGEAVEIDQFKMRYEKIKIIKELESDELMTLTDQTDEQLDYNFKEALHPTHPFLITPLFIEKKHIKLLQQWASVWASAWASMEDFVWASVWGSVRDSVRDSVRASVMASVEASVWGSVRASVMDSVRASVWVPVRDSVRASVEASVWGYMSSLFPNIKKWEYVDHKEGKNPFQPVIDLWHMGLVPSFDGKIWRLHGHKDAKVLFEISKEDLESR